jgi:hypothetical protein
VLEPPLRSRPLVGRRSVLRLMGVAALGLVASCRSGKQQAVPASPVATTPGGSPHPTATSTPASLTSGSPTSASPTSVSPKPTLSAPSPDQLLAQRVAAAEQELIAAYDSTAVAHPELAGRLAPFRDNHVAHLQGLVPGSVADASPYPTNTPLLSAPTSAEIFQSLANLELTAAAARLGDVAATTGSLARLIASIGGCEAAHAALLSVAT